MVEPCPLCERRCRSTDHARQHLHTHHRKSTIIDAYLTGLQAGRHADGGEDAETRGDEETPRRSVDAR
jgi:hypothetical protein